MKLKRLRNLPPARLFGRVPGELNETLTAYQAYYRHLHSEAIDSWPLVLQILETFLSSDREFQAWRRRSSEGPDAHVQSKTGARTESRNG